MNHRPSLQFYPNDWTGDTELSMCSASTRGIWITALCRMWHAENCGSISGTKTQLCRILACNEEEFENFKIEILQTNFGNLTESNKILTLANRRMEKDEKVRKSNAERQKQHYAKGKQKPDIIPNGNLTAPPSSSSSTTKNTITKRRSNSVRFEYENRSLTGLIDQDYIDWSDAFPAVDIRREIKSACQWLIDNPTKRKKQVRRFLTNWLRRCQERGGERIQSNKPIIPPPEIGPDGKTPVDRLREQIERKRNEKHTS